MTIQKREAERIFKRFQNVESLKDYGGMDFDLAKECALICADEIYEQFITGYTKKYFETVKKEIENL